MFGQLAPNKNEQVTVATVLREISRRQLGDQLNEAFLGLVGHGLPGRWQNLGLPCCLRYYYQRTSAGELRGEISCELLVRRSLTDSLVVL